MIDKVVGSLAFLKINWERHKDYIDNFVPFVAECLRTRAEDRVALRDLQSDIRDQFGIQIPESALKTILNRAAKAGYVKAERNVFLKNREALSKCTLGPARVEAQRQFEAVVTRLREYAERKFSMIWSQDQAESALFAFFQSASTPILATAIEGKPIVPPAGGPDVKNSEYVASSFVATIIESDPIAFEFFVTVAKGRMLADVLLYPELGGVQQKFDGVEVYFDTQFVLRALGYAGPALQTPCSEVIELLYGENARLRIFEHTFYEMRGIIEGAAKALRSPKGPTAPGETLQFFIAQNYSPSDVDLILAKLDSSLNRIRIVVKEKPPHVNSYGLNEVEFNAYLEKRIKYKNPEARQHDLDCLTAIHRIRKGQRVRRLERCSAVFVTANPYLARASTEYFTQELGELSDAVPHCLLDHVIGTLVWLKQPLQKPDLPEKRIVADCYAALNPNDQLWREYLAEISKLLAAGNITVDDYNLLRYSIHAKTSLMDLTLGDPDVITEGTIQQVLDRALAKASEKTIIELDEQRSLRLGAEQKAEALALAIGSRQRRLQERVSSLAQKVAFYLSWGAFILALVVLAIGTYFSFPGTFPDSAIGYIRVALVFCEVAAGGFGLVSLINGTDLEAQRRRLELLIAKKAAALLLKQLQEEDDEAEHSNLAT